MPAKRLILQAQGFAILQCFTILFAGRSQSVSIVVHLRIDFLDRGILSYMQQSGKMLTILLTKDEVVAIDDFRFENRMSNRSDAARALLKLALDQIGEDPAKPR